MRKTLLKISFASLLLFITNSIFAYPIYNINYADRSEQLLEQNPVLPVGTEIHLVTTKEIKTNNFKAGDFFFMEVSEDIAQNGKVLIAKGTQAMMRVVISNSDAQKISFGITLDGFMINNYLQKVRTENKSIAVDKPSDSSINVQIVGKSGQKAVIEEGSSIVFPKGNKSVFSLAKALEVNW